MLNNSGLRSTTRAERRAVLPAPGARSASAPLARPAPGTAPTSGYSSQLQSFGAPTRESPKQHILQTETPNFEKWIKDTKVYFFHYYHISGRMCVLFPSLLQGQKSERDPKKAPKKGRILQSKYEQALTLRLTPRLFKQTANMPDTRSLKVYSEYQNAHRPSHASSWQNLLAQLLLTSNIHSPMAFRNFRIIKCCNSSLKNVGLFFFSHVLHMQITIIKLNHNKKINVST